MKRTFFACLFSLAAACLFAFDAEVISLDGKAQVSSDGSAWSPLSVGSKIQQGDTIQTGFKSSLKLKVKGSEITLDPMTRITLDELSEKGSMDNTVVSMKIGGLTSNVKRVEDRRAGFTVRGPAATASVRGTILSEECGYNRDTVTAIENTTLVWPSSAESPEAGDDSAAAPGARAIAPGQVSSVDSNNGQRSPQSHAAERAFDMGGAAPRAAMAEGVAPGPGGMDRGGPGMMGPGGMGGGQGGSESAGGTVTVHIGIEG